MIESQVVEDRIHKLFPHLTERQRRLAAAAEARAIGYGGVSVVARVTGMSRTTMHQGLAELDEESLAPDRSRRPGAGRKRVQDTDPTILKDLQSVVDPSTRGDPMSPLRWTCKSTRELAGALQKMGHAASHTVVAELLRSLGYSLQANMKTLEEGSQHPDRDAQFRYINARVATYMRTGLPVISVDTKKKELIGQHGSVFQEPPFSDSRSN
jgi:hypothetical protein